MQNNRHEIQPLAKVPQLTLGFWVVKVLATTLGETGGDAVSMSMALGYAFGTLIFMALFLASVAAQIRASRFTPTLYWLTIIASTTVGTTLADLPTVRWASAMPAAARCCSGCCWRHCSSGIVRWARST